MVDHIVSVDDNLNFPAPLQNKIIELIQQQAQIVADGGDWIELSLTGWTQAYTTTPCKYRLGGTGDKSYVELRGSLRSDGTTLAFGTLPNLPAGAIPNAKSVYAINASNSANVYIRVAQSGLTVTTAPTDQHVIILDGIKVYL